MAQLLVVRLRARMKASSKRVFIRVVSTVALFAAIYGVAIGTYGIVRWWRFRQSGMVSEIETDTRSITALMQMILAVTFSAICFGVRACLLRRHEDEA